MKKTIFSICFLFLAMFIVVFSGILFPSSAPAPTSYTLDDIYDLIINNSTSTAGNHELSTTSFPIATSSYSTHEIYALLANLIQRENIKTGVTYLGITGDFNNSDPSRPNTSIIYSSLSPSTTTSPTGYSLEDIYNLVVNNSTTSASTHNLSTTTPPNPSMHSITDIYNALSTLIDSANVRSGVTYIGKLGSYVEPICPLGMSGDGISGNACLITSCTQLQAMDQDLSLYYALDNDIDCSETSGWNGGAGFAPVGSSTAKFTGSLDGNYHTITDLYINRYSSHGVGLFGYTDTATISEVGIINGTFNGYYDIGPLVGQATNSTISNCYSSVNVSTGATELGIHFGGLVGNMVGGIIQKSYTTGNLHTAAFGIGGLVGNMQGDATIEDCYSTGNISASRETAGGIVGSWTGSGTRTISNCYSTGNVSAGGAGNAGGIVGGREVGTNLTIKNCFTTGGLGGSNTGGLIGESTTVVTFINDYYITEGAHNYGTQETNGAGAFYNSSHGVYTGSPVWNFGGVWSMNEGLEYPRLDRGIVGSLVCPSGYVKVPADNYFSSNDFCVMKHEAKNVGGVPTSQPSGSRWSANLTDAYSACTSFGADYHLITNREYMTIARNIESTTINDMDSDAGLQLPIGNSNGGMGNIQEATIDPIISGCDITKNMEDPANAYVVGSCEIRGNGIDSKGYYNTGDEWTGNYTSGGIDSQLRTFVLSNGEIIWDIAGNAHDVVDLSDHGVAISSGLSCSGDEGTYSFYQDDGSPECSFINGYAKTNASDKRYEIGPSGNYNRNNGMGIISNNAISNVVAWRGGAGDWGNVSGIYSYSPQLYTSNDGSESFRCAYKPLR